MRGNDISSQGTNAPPSYSRPTATALRNLPFRLLLIGFDDEVHRRNTLSGLSQMERRAVLNGRLLWVQNPEFSTFYRSADAFVMNSQGSGENFGE